MNEPKTPKQRREEKRAAASAMSQHEKLRKRKEPDPKVDFDELLRRAAQPKE